MSKYVREIDSIQALRNTPTSDAAAAHVRTPTGQSGVFVPMDGDPFGRGDDGATALQASDGTWWTRESIFESGTVSVRSFGASPTASAATNASAIKAAIDFAENEQNVLVVVPHGTYILDSTMQINFPINFLCLGVLQQADGANLAEGVVNIQQDTNFQPSRLRLQLNVDGNRNNNSTAIGVTFTRLRDASAVEISCTGCTSGVNVEGETEGNEITVRGFDCGTLVNYGTGTGTPDSNTLRISGLNCDTFYETVSGGSTSSVVHLACEQSYNEAVIIRGGTHHLTGQLRVLAANGDVPGMLVDGNARVGLDLQLLGTGDPTWALKVNRAFSVRGSVFCATNEGVWVRFTEQASELQVRVEDTRSTPGLRLGETGVTALNAFTLSEGSYFRTPAISGVDVLYDACFESTLHLNEVGEITISEGFNQAEQSTIFIGPKGRDVSITDNSSSGEPPRIVFTGVLTDAERSSLTPLRGMTLESNADDDFRENVYTGTNWILPDGTTT
jgi:hypothetical protein